MNKLGPHVHDPVVHFGILLPGVTPQGGYEVWIRIIHEDDQFIQDESSYRQNLQHCVEPAYGDYWQAEVDLSGPGSGKHWGRKGRYIYRYGVTRPDGREIDWVIDPFAREFGVGKHAAFTYGYEPYEWEPPEWQWRTPRHHDLVLYEMNVMEFAGSLEQAAERLDYLADLGVNALSLMPVTNIADAIDWGYTPIGYFGVDERFGKRRDFQEFVAAAHQRGLALLVDAIYGHTNELFPYEYLYGQLAGVQNPMMGPFAKNDFGASVDWTKSFAQDFFYTVNHHWLEVYHVDGFRYDCVPNYWELAPDYRGFASIAYHTYQLVKSRIGAGDPSYARFADGENPLRLIQCAEQLEAPATALEQTYSTCTWQNGTISAAEKIARGDAGGLVELGCKWGAVGFPVECTVHSDRLYKSPLQYIENHDHSRFLCNFGLCNPHDELKNVLFAEGDRSRWPKVQPYLIGMLMAKGIPLLWQGQELCERAALASGGPGRTSFLHLVHWQYFYEKEGRSVLTLVRRLLRLRQQFAHLRTGESYFFNDGHYHSQNVLLFARLTPNAAAYTLVALNFTDATQWVPFWFPIAGDYREELHGQAQPELNLTGVNAYAERWIEIPSNYGRIWTHV
jgi:1,4-alpha-glucan branching enzyme